jgi:hypothetical protein
MEVNIYKRFYLAQLVKNEGLDDAFHLCNEHKYVLFVGVDA